VSLPDPGAIGLVGSGRTGSVVAELAARRGIEVAWTARASTGGVEAIGDDEFRRAAVVIEFAVPYAAEQTLARCLAAGVPAVSGTTGWEERRHAWIERFRREGGGLVYGSNFSIGVHVFMRAAEELARGLGGLGDYDPMVSEQHHRGKADAPSGTALTLIERILPHLQGKDSYTVMPAGPGRIAANALSVAVTRAGSVPGTHSLSFDGPFDTVSLQHQARSNQGFASGALLAAAWLTGRSGVWSARELFDLLTKPEGTQP
jgi:4-hydroxy-tetrahydrodipicolinate reductase